MCICVCICVDRYILKVVVCVYEVATISLSRAADKRLLLKNAFNACIDCRVAVLPSRVASGEKKGLRRTPVAALRIFVYICEFST